MRPPYRSADTELAQMRRMLDQRPAVRGRYEAASARLQLLEGAELQRVQAECERLFRELEALHALEVAYVDAFDAAVASLMHDTRVRRWRAELDRTRAAGRAIREQTSRLRDLRVLLAELVGLLAEPSGRRVAADLRGRLGEATRAAGRVKDPGVRIHVRRAGSLVRLVLGGSSLARPAAARQLHRTTARVSLCESRLQAEHDGLRARHDYAQTQLIAFVEGE